ncbi:hypothetical protein GQ43DRAFT_473619 [Delitschia confertaspora ATCC 74209]|uniref:Conserved oligomeric Golgi complex subunit 1 n=1 Tax=Delitschia confertaspora ATCC 74209 TaxID=1513339 RepID=A0A9P4JJI7_9PLEO|nr:hypothetical protein GQ43DRAFT_473619 [Delitschia confertaspora ATCC 74209]
MASEAPDPRTFSSWEDAFKYPVPVVRKLENQLRSNATDNREKLRSLVGASYRSLLDTAETIIDMENRMQQVETKLARVGQRCNSRGVDRISSNATRMVNNSKARERYTFASQLSVLQNCPTVISRLIREKESYLLAVKVLVISRLLYKALSQSEDKPPFLDQIRDRLSALRNNLLKRIDKRISSKSSEVPILVESMCAYALITSSAPTDVLRHFHHVRMEEIGSLLKGAEDLTNNGIAALKLCLQTCQDTQAIFPRRLAESLARLKAHPLLQDPDIQGLHELNLDIHGRWLSNETRDYTPWPRHDELQRPEAERLLIVWSKQAMSTFLKGIKEGLLRLLSLREVTLLRQELFETIILAGIRMPGLKPAKVLDDLRDAINSQLGSLVHSRARDIDSVVSEITKRLENWHSAGDDANGLLWSPSSLSVEISDGGQSFKENIISKQQGRDERVKGVTTAYDKWAESVLEVKSIVKSMREARWDDTFADDSGDSGDEFDLDSSQGLLGNDDPLLLEETAQEALNNALSSLQKDTMDIVRQLTAKEQYGSIEQVIFVLRVVREIGDRVPRLALQDRKSMRQSTPFTSSLLDPLYQTLAQSTIQPTVQAYERAITTSPQSDHSPDHILWEGNPPLPIQPSPSAFRFLRDLSKRMGAYGSDLWAPSVTKVLKDATKNELVRIWCGRSELLRNRANAVNGAHGTVDTSEPDQKEEDKPEGPPKGEEGTNDRQKQLLFDMFYILQFLHAPAAQPASEKNTGKLVDEMREGLKMEDNELARLRRNATDYHKRTYLLFALLL